MSETDAERAARYAELEAKYPTKTKAEFRTQSRRSLLTGGAAALAGLVGWRWVQGNDTWLLKGNGVDDNIPAVLRDVHELNEKVWRGLYRDDHLAPTFDRSDSSMLRVNGTRGMRQRNADGNWELVEVDVDAWSLTVFDQGRVEVGTHLMDDIRSLPMHEMTVEHKCVEGWSHIVTWGGVRFSDFVEAFYPEQLENPTTFVSLMTPDGGYYVGLEWDAMMHPQTLLCYQLQGEPLDQRHGAPLRLVTPLKYGIKQIKRIGTIAFTNEQPADYWAERGYDWYAAL